MRARARTLFDNGLSCNAIAKTLGFAPSTISRWAKKESLSFDRTKTAIAVRAHTVDLAESRLLLSQKLMVSSHDAVDALDGKFLVYNFGGKDNTYEEHLLDEVPVDVREKIHRLAGVAIDKATRILEKDNGGLDITVGVLDALAGNLTAAAALLRLQDDVPLGDTDAV
jgi:predicted transcriptional regulator